MKKNKVLLITNIIVPYRIPVWNYVAKQEDFDFKIFFMKEREYNREWQVPLEEIKFKYEILKGFHLLIKRLSWEIHCNFGIFPKLKKENPDIVILDGYDTLTVWLAFLFAKLYKKKIVAWIGSTLLYSKKTKGIIGSLKKLFIKGADVFIAYGKLAKEYLLFLGAEENKIFVGCNVGNINFFKRKAESFRQSQEFFKERKKYPKIVFLFVGRLVKEKGVMEMLYALRKIKEKDCGLIIVGNGPLLAKITDFMRSNKLRNKIWFVGFKQKEDLIKYYALADIFLFPSLREPYGIVLSEAIAAGLFVLSSKYAGATYDLLREGKAGFVIDPKDIDDFKAKIELTIKRFSEKPWSRKEISNSIEKFSPEFYGQKVIEAVKATKTL